MKPAAEDQHPERVCGRCHGPNVVWCAPSPLWNQVMRGGNISEQDAYGGIVCPTCFVILAEAAGVASEWRLSAQVHVPLPLVTPDGRAWDDELWMWVDPRDDPSPTTGGPVDYDWPPGCRCYYREDAERGDVRTAPPGGCPIHSCTCLSVDGLTHADHCLIMKIDGGKALLAGLLARPACDLSVDALNFILRQPRGPVDPAELCDPAALMTDWHGQRHD